MTISTLSRYRVPVVRIDGDRRSEQGLYVRAETPAAAEARARVLPDAPAETDTCVYGAAVLCREPAGATR